VFSKRNWGTEGGGAVTIEKENLQAVEGTFRDHCRAGGMSNWGREPFWVLNGFISTRQQVCWVSQKFVGKGKRDWKEEKNIGSRETVNIFAN